MKFSVKESTVRMWVKDKLKITESEEDLKTRSMRRMPDYRGDAEARPTPRSTRSSTGGEQENLSKVLKNINSPRIKIGDGTVMSQGDPGYDEWKRGREWTEEDLPVKGAQLSSVTGVLLDIKKSNDKLMMAAEYPEFVMQMLVKAVSDYKQRLVESMKVVRAGLHDYIMELSEVLDPAEAKDLMDPIGMLHVASSPDFREYFNRWCSRTQDDTYTRAAPAHLVRFIFENRVHIDSALNVVVNAMTFDVNDSMPSKLNVAEDLGLDTKWNPTITRVDAVLLHDPNFRYFVDGKGIGKGSRTNYWNWVRNSIEKLGKGKYKGQF